MKKILFFCVWVYSGFVFSKGSTDYTDLYQYKFYFGGVGGNGSTTWGGLVPSEENRNDAMSISTPILVREGGAVWGLVAGYEITPYLALEANYMHFPKAKITFDVDSLFAFEQDGRTVLYSNTQVGSIMARIMLVIPDSPFRLYSGAGAACVWREDDISSDNRISPTFAFGATLTLSKRLMLEIGSNYTAGYGESELNPANDFIPFVYSFYGKLAYRFGLF